MENKPWDLVENVGDFVYLLLEHTGKASDIYKNLLMGDINTYKYIRALEESKKVSNDKTKNRILGNIMYITSPESLKSGVLPKKLKEVSNEFFSGKYPKQIKELEITGNDLINLGFKQGPELGKKLREILILIYSDKLKNNKTELIEFIKSGL